ncbi:hypothetical protein ACFO5O_01310 [Geojedonia litorea]|uniref:Lipocalin-like domain-containing protein n=1 Tax=Geojedonia litorea TaxID=1268269 RepID=A0ABV9N2G0_9FLAO
MKTRLLTLLAVALLIACADQNPSNTTPDTNAATGLNGAWQVTHMEWSNADTSIVKAPFHKSIYIYTNSYYSVAAAIGERPSAPEVKEGEAIDADYFKQVYLGYLSNAGTYSRVGDSLIHQVMVAKSPTVMNNNTRIAQHFKLDKDTLILSSADPYKVTTLRLIRLEE